LVDAQASAELTRRLLALQRQRLSESQVVDQRVRRSLHDDILPRLHAALLELSAAAPASEGLTTLAHVHRDLSALLRTMPSAAQPEVARLGVFGALRRLLESELPNTFDSIVWQITPEAEQAAQRLPAYAAETVFYAAREALRNAARHGRGVSAARALRLQVSAALSGDALEIGIADDGVGLDASASNGTGTRQGLALHSALLAALGGTLSVANGLHAGVRVTILTPLPRA
jgi:signal transduction histidine kinase